MIPLEFPRLLLSEKTRVAGLPCDVNRLVIGFDTIPSCNGRTDPLMDGRHPYYIPRYAFALHMLEAEKR